MRGAPAIHVTRHTSHATRHTSNVTRHTSHVTRHTSRVTRHTSNKKQMEKVMVRGEQLRQTCICIVLMNKYTNATAGVSQHPARNIVDGMDMGGCGCGCGCGCSCRTTCEARAAALLQERVVHKVE
jgi:hypothetical protein